MYIFDKQFHSLQTALTQVDASPSGQLAAGIAALPKPGTLPDARTTWLVISVILYHARQRWARKELCKHLPSFFVGKGQSPPLREGLPIPGMTDWQVEIVFDTWGTIAHKSTREHVAGLSRCGRRFSANFIFPHEIPAMVPSNSPWDIPGRLAAATRGSEMEVAVAELVAARILLETDFYGMPWEDIGDPDAHMLSRRGRGMSRGVFRFHRLWGDSRHRLWLAAAIGDWQTANELAILDGDQDVCNALAERLEEYRQRRLVLARCNLSLAPDSVYDLEVLYRQGGEDFQACASRSVATMGAQPILAKLLLETGDPQWNQQLFDTLKRLSVEQDGPFHREIFRLAQTLLERSYRADEVLDMLANYGLDLDQTAMLFLKYAPARALAVIRKALRDQPDESEDDEPDDEIPGTTLCCTRMAATLAIIDEPWSRQEIIEAINELWTRYHDYPRLTPLALALCESRDPATRETGDSWRLKCHSSKDWDFQEWDFRSTITSQHDGAISLRGVTVTAEADEGGTITASAST